MNTRKIVSKELSHNPSNLGYVWLLFIIAPIFALIIAIKNFKQKNLRKFIILFGGLYGLFFIVLPGSDATRFQTYYINHGDYSFKQYLSDIANIGSSENQFPDVYAYTMFFLGNLVSNNPQFFHMLTALVYFFVFVKLVGSIYDKDSSILRSYYSLFFLGIIFILNFSSGINGVRWPLGFIVFIYGAINLLTQKKIKFLFIAALSLLIHFSFYPAVLALTAFFYIPFLKNTNVLILFGLLTLTIGSLFSDLIFTNVDELGVVAEDKLLAYTGDAYLEKRVENVESWNSYVFVSKFGSYFFACGVLLIMWIKQKHMNTNETTERLFTFAVLMASFSFIANSIVDLSTNRYTLIVTVITFTYLIYLGILNKNAKTLRILMYAYAPIIILRAFLIIRVDLETLSIQTLISPIIAFLL